ncbi:unnamed protein product [Bursaphelenchus xylophilus]|uniref:(pine wood nematode) hypothetical protein n=1 Tax=Bursaphelenchus xylophilus TaxID=6326 RepID=A0A1I7SLU2_BURXY|nr:unnamed protein product [Bursaphelenchus xylophilus]CAG9129840.1 unnamed protein product [Bursaphelenchus xylophilus]
MEPELKEKLLARDDISLDFEDARSVIDNGHYFRNPDFYERALSIATVLPPMELTWNNVTVFPIEDSEKSCSSRLGDLYNAIIKEKPSRIRRGRILDSVCGIARSGEVLALMGASGAGKTSLLNILTQRNLSTVRVEGEVRVNGIKMGKEQLRKMSAYVQQDDLFIGTMTVMEHLKFMATLRMGRSYSKAERERRVYTVMNDLGLIKCANTIIGTPFQSKGLSGGERKRLAFASEILTSPPLLFCDEPTSGLDSYLAQQIVQLLKNLAKTKNMTVVLTIHQPSSQVFELFDKVCLLADGRTAFLGSMLEASMFWKGMGMNLPDNYNPGDFFINTLTQDEKDKKNKKAKKICDAFDTSDIGKELKKTVAKLHQADTSGSSNSDSDIHRTHDVYWNDKYKYRSTWFQQFVVLTKRSFLVTIREPMLLKVKLIQTIIISIILGLIYFNTPVKQSTIMNINGLLYQAASNMNFMFQFAALGMICAEYPIFLREHLSGTYRVSSYFLAKNVAELVQYIVYPVVFSSITYWMCGLYASFWAFLIFTFNTILMTNAAVSVAYFFACLFPSINVSSAIMPILVIPLLAFGGFFINQNTLPWYFMPLKYLSYFGYVFENMAINEWSGIEQIPCEDTRNCLESGQEVLESLSFNADNLIFNTVALILMIITLRFIGFLALLTHASNKK